ncbi:ATP-grasp domain-containing protein [Neobacillus sp. OS1-32]|jgi:biotin carboxylase|uniref:ATP-grasp domain-containing protein n=1 Tax=Neobacillus sp. OS1-32 TaxID=3070682 RepID=UPI0027DF29AD|nr:ATP-grasp domain-containing protein [Neobacillus sp. OS1-32]WML30319.1 ATP-grasp domain-containing protein [Neobacillus sp. OS1-32]
MKKLLLLGGSTQQIPAIVRAKELGHYTILCDYLPDNPGQHYAHKFYCVSTTNKEKILEVAQKEQINGILAYASDPAALTAAYVGEKLNLPTQPYRSVEILTNKDLFRVFLRENGFLTPKAKGYASFEEARAEIEEFRLPVIIKPVDSSGSKGVGMLTDVKDLDKYIVNALHFSRVKRFIIEEFIEKNGFQVAGDGFSIDGKLVFRCFSNNHFNKECMNPFVPVGTTFPSIKCQVIQEKIHDEIQRLLDLLGMRTGAYNFEVFLDSNEDIYLMEVGPRNGGDYIPQVIRHATGIDLVQYSIKAALGEKCSELQMKETSGYWGYYAIHSRNGGYLKEIKMDEKVKIQNLVESYLNYNVGDYVPAFNGSNCTLGIIIMKFSSMNEMLDKFENPHHWIEVDVEESSLMGTFN